MTRRDHVMRFVEELVRAAEENELDLAAQRDARLREFHVQQGVCHRHPHVRVSTGGGFPAYDAPCGACEAEMDS